MSIYVLAGEEFSSELYHYGIKGQKWGVRRFQNEDGTLTNAGKEHYNKNPVASSDKSKDKMKKIGKAALGVVGTAAIAYGGYKLATSDIGREYLSNKADRISDNLRKIRDAKNAHKMTDEVLLKKIGRLEKEMSLRKVTYQALTSSPNPREQILMDSGKKIASAAITGFGTYAAYALLNKKFEPKELARYSFSNPNKNKK